MYVPRRFADENYIHAILQTFRGRSDTNSSGIQPLISVTHEPIHVEFQREHQNSVCKGSS
jgi:hypothetical protein